MVKVAVVEGDGIGREVVPAARDILAAVRPDIEFFDVDLGYGLWERTGCACGEETVADLGSADAILFGAVTTPPDPGYRSVMLQIRHALDLYANVRPIRGDTVDVVIVRENTEGSTPTSSGPSPTAPAPSGSSPAGGASGSPATPAPSRSPAGTTSPWGTRQTS